MKGKIVLSFLLLIGLVACNLPAASGGGVPAGPTTDPQIFVQTAMAQTLEVQTQFANAVKQTLEVQTQLANAVQQTLQAMVTDTPQFTLTPSLTVTPSLTITPTFTLTLAAPMVSVSMDTNCRTGPGAPYPSLGSLMVGETAEVVGRSPAGDFWIIKNPDGPGTCWLWKQYATVTGDTSGLPIIQPPPTQTPTLKPQPVVQPPPVVEPPNIPNGTLTVYPNPVPVASNYHLVLCGCIPGTFVEVHFSKYPSGVQLYAPETATIDGGGCWASPTWANPGLDTQVLVEAFYNGSSVASIVYIMK